MFRRGDNVSQALYRKYRSKNLDEIVGQPAVTTALKNALKNSQISHAYLFTGPRGVGKTSVARILAYEVNNLPYNDDNLPIDVIEIDAASNRRIDEIRDLRDKVNIAPVSSKYKVYIIDEVHMLTREAFNALLKTLEEPPAHVIFILATTEAHKLPETIISRTQRYNFKLASQNDVAEHLAYIAKKEGIKIDTESLQIIAKHSGGSLRDAISILDQIRHSSSDIKPFQVRNSIGLPSETVIDNIIGAYLSNEPKKLIEGLTEAFDEGISSVLIANQLIDYCKNQLVDGNSELSNEELIRLIEALIKVESNTKPEIQLELVLINSQFERQKSPASQTLEAHIATINPPLTISAPAINHKKATDTVANTNKTQEIAQNVLDIDGWLKVLSSIRKKHNTIYGILRIADTNFDQIYKNQLSLYFRYPFHQKRIQEPHNKKIILDELKSFGYRGIKINSKLAEQAVEPNSPENPTRYNSSSTNEDDINTASLNKLKSIFGNAEVLE